MLSGSATEKQIIMRSASLYDRGRTLSYLWEPAKNKKIKYRGFSNRSALKI